MMNKKELAQLLFKNLGLFSLIVGIAFTIFGALNLGSIPYYYEAISGGTGLDSSLTVLLNITLWLAFCYILMQIGVKFYLISRDIDKIELNKQGKVSIHFCLIGASIVCGLIIFLLLLLFGLIQPLQFYPHVLFAGEETLMDLSIIMNSYLLLACIFIIYRVGWTFVKYGFKIGEIL